MLSQTIADFTTLAIAAGGWMEMDRLYLHNRILGMIGEDQLDEFDVHPVTRPSTELLDELVAVVPTGYVASTHRSPLS